MADLQKEFKDAQSKLNTLSSAPGNDVKLKLYGLFKQATAGDCNTSRPGMTDFVGRAKWDAWNQLKGISKNEGAKKYIDYVNQLLNAEGPSKPITKEEMKNYTEIKVSIENNSICKITLNRPDKLNALSIKTYHELINALQEADRNPNVILCAITGTGKFYSSGNDLSNFTSNMDGNQDELINTSCKLVESLISTLINFRKPLIGLINGPCVGIAFTTIALFDLIIASDKATFNAPFTMSALSPEGCSSYTFPLLMGKVKASEILLFNRKLTAHEAFERNIVNEIIPASEFEEKCQKKLLAFSKLPKNSLLESKNFIKELRRDKLLKVNEKEMELLKQRIKSGEVMEAVMNFFDKKSKL